MPTDSWQTMNQDPTGECTERLRQGLNQAGCFRAVVDDYTAKLAAAHLGGDAPSAVNDIAHSGKVDVAAVLDELQSWCEARPGSLDFRHIVSALGAYVVAAGDRDAVEAWPILRDTGPPMPPGYMGTYASPTEFLREIGFRVIELVDGSVHVFQEPGRW